MLRWLVLEGRPPGLLTVVWREYFLSIKVFNARIDLAVIWNKWKIVTLESR
jgi:hypothetical protein